MQYGVNDFTDADILNVKKSPPTTGAKLLEQSRRLLADRDDDDGDDDDFNGVESVAEGNHVVK